jgi:hypothetical protein
MRRVATAMLPMWIALGCSREQAPISGAKPSTAPVAAAASPAVATAAFAPAAPVVPRGLSCLARLYAGKPVLAESEWWLELPEGARIRWDDRRAKSAEERLDAPDLEDMLAPPYPIGPIAKVTLVDHDPGRARVEKLFEATYGATEKAVRSALVPWKIRGHVLVVHPRALPAFERVRVLGITNERVHGHVGSQVGGVAEGNTESLGWPEVPRRQEIKTLSDSHEANEYADTHIEVQERSPGGP